MNAPRNRQYVKVNIGGEWEFGRYSDSHIMCDDMPGYDLHNAKFINARGVSEWRDASDQDPMGYDLSMGVQDDGNQEDRNAD